MSTCTPKDNATNFESCVTLTLDAEKTGEPEKSSYGAKREREPPGKSEEEHANFVGNSDYVDMKNSRTRYFIIKSLNYNNIQVSVKKGIWATQVMNEPILEEAFNSARVILIFSVNGSGVFQGYAEMVSSIGGRWDSVWSQADGVNNPWGRSFEVNWLQQSFLPFQKTLHLINPWNEFKPVKISRDCQELPVEIGEALCKLIDGESLEDPNLKRPDLESGCSFPKETFNASPVDVTWGMTSAFHPAYQYNYHSEVSNWHLGHGSVGVPPPECSTVMANHGELTRVPNRKGNTHNSPIESDVSSQVDSWSMSGEMSPLCSTITDDELLEMSYEQYVENYYARNGMQLHQPAGGSWQKKAGGQLQKKEDSSSKDRDSNDMRNHRNHAKSHKRSRR